jgi:hypothetical protein
METFESYGFVDDCFIASSSMVTSSWILPHAASIRLAVYQ